jgi:hypothetical protein
LPAGRRSTDIRTLRGALSAARGAPMTEPVLSDDETGTLIDYAP